MNKTILFLACFAFCSSVSASPSPDIVLVTHESHFTTDLNVFSQPTSAIVLEVCDYNVQAIDEIEFIVLLDRCIGALLCGEAKAKFTN